MHSIGHACPFLTSAPQKGLRANNTHAAVRGEAAFHRRSSRRTAFTARSFASVNAGAGGGSGPPGRGKKLFGGDGDAEGKHPLALLSSGLQAFTAWLLFQQTISLLLDALNSLRLPRHADSSSWKLSIIIPALNEERAIAALLLKLRASLPSEAVELIVVDGGSSDRTVAEAKKTGVARVISSPQRGRAAQMNAGAAAASGQLLAFMHADTLGPPADLLRVLRQELADPRTVLIGTRTLIRGTGKQHCSAGGSHGSSTSSSDEDIKMQASCESSSSPSSVSQQEEASSCGAHRRASNSAASTSGGQQDDVSLRGPLLKVMTFHQLMKTYFYPMLLRPQSYMRGFRLMFGDQVLCCRAADFKSVQGYHVDLPIMEDATLCIDLHMNGPCQETARGYKGRGRVKQLNRVVTNTSGRRLEAWGNVWGTWVLFRIALAWYGGASGEQLKGLYQKLYTDVFR